MVYMIFVGLVIAAAAASPSAPIGNAIIMSAGLVAATTSASTAGLSAMLGGQSSLSESVKANLWALIAVGLMFLFGYQVGIKAPAVFLASPLLACIAGTVILSKGLSLSIPRALVVSLTGAVIAYFALKLSGGSIVVTRVVRGSS
jgi:hypothetical protein